MRRMEAIDKLASLDRHGIYVLTTGDLAKAFPTETSKGLEMSIRRLVADGVLERVARGTFLFKLARSKRGYVVENIASVLRRGHYTYLSLESMLSEYGVISQIPISRLTLMTTGPRGLYHTPYGTIEFTHTKRPVAHLIQRTLSVKGRPLRLATRAAAISDLARTGRNHGMIDPNELA